jgi:hypothetical protein
MKISMDAKMRISLVDLSAAGMPAKAAGSD